MTVLLPSTGRVFERGGSAEIWGRYYENADIVGEYESLAALTDAESAILHRLAASKRGAIRMLDIGVGAGRTTSHFASVAAEYLGIDASRRMIDACRRRYGNETRGRVSFAVCDVRDMRMLPDDWFDFVLFSWNGLDFVGGHQDRHRALREIARVCHQGGQFAFSSLNLNGESVWRRKSVRWAVTATTSGESRRKVASEVVNRLAMCATWWVDSPSPARLAVAGHAQLVTGRHGRRLLRAYHIRPGEQLTQLREVGFRDARVLSATGQELPEAMLARTRIDWPYYVCTKA